MTRAAYVGVENKARNVKEIYVGVDNVARKVLKGYVGDENGIARQFWPPYDDGSPKHPYDPPDDPFNPPDTPFEPDPDMECPGGSRCLKIFVFPGWFNQNWVYGYGGGNEPEGATYYVLRYTFHSVVCSCGREEGSRCCDDSNMFGYRVIDRVVERNWTLWGISEIGNWISIDSGTSFQGSHYPVWDYYDLERWHKMWNTAIASGQKCTDPLPVLPPRDPSTYPTYSEQSSAFVSNTNFDTVLLDPDTLTEEDESVVLQNAQLNNPVDDNIELEEIN
jgi:hypothetical protein